MKLKKLKTTLAALVATYALSSTPAHADIGDAIRAPVGGQVQVIAGQRIAQQGASSAVSITGKVKDEIMYGGITFTYNSALPAPSLTLEAGPHLHPDKWHLLSLADVTFPLNGATPTLGAALYAMAKPDEKFSLDVGGRYSYNTATNTHSLEGRVTPATALSKGWFVGEETVVQYDVNGSFKVTTGPVFRYAAGASHFTLVPAYQLTATSDGVQHAFVYSVRGRLGVPKKKLE